MRVHLGLMIILWGWATTLSAAEPTTEYARGQKMLASYFELQTKQLSERCLSQLTSLAEFEKQKPELRRQFFDMMGLWPLPARTELKPVITGKLETEHFVVEKLHFQSSPGLYVTGNMYLPNKRVGRAPAVLYVCGHARVEIDKVPLGNKTAYQHHPAWLAEQGYVCLAIDTLQLGELAGLHHGTHNLGLWAWHSLGYTPAGIELWNGMRALDYLESRPEVDAKKLGVTGRSGGGATSWWLAAADDRVQCAIPVAGIADLHAHVVEGLTPRFKQGVISGHCDCMYFVNTYRWDFAQVVALCAPRPVLLGNSDDDAIFPVPGYRRLAEKAKKVYEFHGVPDRFALLETAGPHKDTPELRQGAFRWLNRWLKNDLSEVTEPARPRFDPRDLQVIRSKPEDVRNQSIHESFVKTTLPQLPSSPEVAKTWWTGQQSAWLKDLQEHVFRGWPEKPVAPKAKFVGEKQVEGLTLKAYDFTSEPGVELRLWLAHAPGKQDFKTSEVLVLDPTSWQELSATLGQPFSELLQAGSLVAPKDEGAKVLKQMLALSENALVFVAPRGVGPTAWAKPGSADETHIRRRFALLGQTEDGQRVWDVRQALAVVQGLKETKGTTLTLKGVRSSAVLALYASLFEPEVQHLELKAPTLTHRDNPQFLNILRHFDIPQAVALAFPKKIVVHTGKKTDRSGLAWPVQLQELLGKEHLTFLPATLP